jgi:hypothetical protein
VADVVCLFGYQVLIVFGLSYLRYPTLDADNLQHLRTEVFRWTQKLPLLFVNQQRPVFSAYLLLPCAVGDESGGDRLLCA